MEMDGAKIEEADPVTASAKGPAQAKDFDLKQK